MDAHGPGASGAPCEVEFLHRRVASVADRVGTEPAITPIMALSSPSSRPFDDTPTATADERPPRRGGDPQGEGGGRGANEAANEDPRAPTHRSRSKTEPLVPRIWAVVNPRSGTAEPAEAVARLRARHGDFSLLEPSSESEFEALGQRLERSLRDGSAPDVVVAAGGDGTVSAVATALWRAKTALGSRGVDHASPRAFPRLAIIPMGTANVLAGELGVPDDLEAACELVGTGETRELDVMTWRDRALLCRFVVGDLARPGTKTSSEQKQRLGPLAYGINAVSELVEPTIQPYQLEIDGEALETEASSLVLTNLARTGLRDLRWGPTISAHDGALDLLIIRATGLLDNLGMLWKSVLEELGSDSGIEHWRVKRELLIRGPAEMAAVADGEMVEGDFHRLVLRPGALRVLAPASTVKAEG